jgi:hypothetical protein
MIPKFPYICIVKETKKKFTPMMVDYGNEMVWWQKGQASENGEWLSYDDVIFEEKDKSKQKITIPMEISYDPDRKKNFLHIRFAECCITVKNDEEEIGRIESCIGGGVELRDKEDGKTYYMSSINMWNAFCDFLGKPDNKIDKEKLKEEKEKNKENKK